MAREFSKGTTLSEPLAYLLTWTCYGTWLHGDARGSVDDEHNIPGTPPLDPDPLRREVEEQRLRHGAVVLSEAGRKVVAKTITDHCRYRDWELLAENVRTNHVHVVVACADTPAPDARSQLKAWTTRRLREAGCVGRDTRVWSYRGSVRYLWDERAVNNAIAYVSEYQGPDLP